MKAISIRQPFAWLVAAGYKDIECRSWATKYRGPLFILALKQAPTPEDIQDAKRMCRNAGFDITLPEHYDIGGIVGMAHLADCVTASRSPWHSPGTFGFVLTQAHPIEFRPYRGVQRLFNIEGLDHLWDEYPPLAVEPRPHWLTKMRARIEGIFTLF